MYYNIPTTTSLKRVAFSRLAHRKCKRKYQHQTGNHTTKMKTNQDALNQEFRIKIQNKHFQTNLKYAYKVHARLVTSRAARPAADHFFHLCVEMT